jgi:hypothetical protein
VAEWSTVCNLKLGRELLLGAVRVGVVMEREERADVKGCTLVIPGMIGWLEFRAGVEGEVLPSARDGVDSCDELIFTVAEVRVQTLVPCPNLKERRTI